MKSIINKPSNRILMLLLFLFIITNSCKKFVDVKAPVTSINSANVYANDQTAIAVLTGVYAKIANTPLPSLGIASLSLYPGLSSDELTLFSYSNQISSSYYPYYLNALTSSNTGSPDFWNQFYSTIFIANSAVEGLSNSTTLTPVIKKQLIGEAKFIRAFCYFYLINLYGDVPLAVSSDYNINQHLSRSDKSKAYQLVISDLKDAENSLIDGYLQGDRISLYPQGAAEKIFPNKWAAAALLARTYLYTGDYTNAIAQSTAVIQSGLYNLEALSNVFLKNNVEAIWQLQPTTSSPTTNTYDAYLFVIPATGPTVNGKYPVYLSNSLVNSIEIGDNRKAAWISAAQANSSTYYYPNKYKINTPHAPVAEYNTVFRLAEQFLIRAEAEANGGGGGVTAAVTDLDIIRARAGLNNYAGSQDRVSVLAAIFHERQVELFTEWGHRWFDLKRSGKIDSTMNIVCPMKGGIWNPNWALYPIPVETISTDPFLTQNPGY